MSETTFFTEENRKLADEIIGRYPRRRSAMIPLLHLAQEQAGWINQEAMREIAVLVGSTPAEVLGTGTFYEMFKFHEVGKYVINICGTMSCHLLGADELIHHAEQRLGIKVGATTSDKMFTLERAECQAACTEAPTLQVNYRHRYRMTTADFDKLVDDLAAGKLVDQIPDHGVLARVKQIIPLDRAVGVADPDDVDEPPTWMPAEQGAS